jgi:hypothetical protein
MRAGLLASALIITFAAGASAQFGRTIRVQTSEYSYEVPGDWREQSSAGVEHMHGSVAYPGRTINITTEAFTGTPAQYLQASLTGLRGQRQVQLGATRQVNVGSLEGYEIESDWHQNNVVVHLIQVATSHNGRGYVLTCGDLAERFAQAESECRAIFRTFTVGPDVMGAGLRVEGPGYRYTVPSGWTESTGGSTDRQHTSNTTQGRSVNLTTEPWNGTVPGYRAASEQGLRAESHVRVIQVRDANVGALPGLEIDSLWIEGDVTVHLLQLGTSYNGRGYVLTCGDLEQNFQAGVAECRRILATFVVGGLVGGPNSNPHASTIAVPSQGTHGPVASEIVTARVREAVNARSGDLSECQAAALRRGPVAGQVELEMIVRRDGTVAGVRILTDGTGSAGLASCVQGVVSGIRVSNPPTTDTTVRHTVAFGR